MRKATFVTFRLSSVGCAEKSMAFCADIILRIVIISASALTVNRLKSLTKTTPKKFITSRISETFTSSRECTCSSLGSQGALKNKRTIRMEFNMTHQLPKTSFHLLRASSKSTNGRKLISRRVYPSTILWLSTLPLTQRIKRTISV